MLDLARDSPGETRPILASFRLLPDRHGHLAGSSRQEINRRNRDRSEYGLGDSYPVLLVEVISQLPINRVQPIRVQPITKMGAEFGEIGTRMSSEGWWIAGQIFTV
ncbi:hypothetical protein T01_3099 [Trichinella spiralis]|uniref:Uncharacterized protein n=1 Tax=Trichinella spiralis TaxID=6334 RepID=A0A0V1AJI2_TRISP|nr:hypothetical protein T01_3099 [Trichinella spiralis]